MKCVIIKCISSTDWIKLMVWIQIHLWICFMIVVCEILFLNNLMNDLRLLFVYIFWVPPKMSTDHVQIAIMNGTSNKSCHTCFRFSDHNEITNVPNISSPLRRLYPNVFISDHSPVIIIFLYSADRILLSKIKSPRHWSHQPTMSYDGARV